MEPTTETILLFEEGASRAFRKKKQGGGNGEYSVCLDSKSFWFGTTPMGGSTRYDLIKGGLTNEVKEPDPQRLICSAGGGKKFIYQFQEVLVPLARDLERVMLNGAKLKKNLSFDHPVVWEEARKKTEFRFWSDINRKLQKFDDKDSTLSEKLMDQEITNYTVCNMYKLCDALRRFERIQRADLQTHVRIFEGRIHEHILEPNLLFNFWNNAADPASVFHAEYMTFVKPWAYFTIQKSRFKHFLEFKKISGSRLKFVVKNVPEVFFRKPKGFSADTYGNGSVDGSETPEGDLPDEQGTDPGTPEHPGPSRSEETFH